MTSQRNWIASSGNGFYEQPNSSSLMLSTESKGASRASQTLSETSVITDRETGRSKGFGFVEMSSNQQAQAAIEQLNGTLLGNRTITVNEARERQAAGGRGFQGREPYSNMSYRSQRY